MQGCNLQLSHPMLKIIIKETYSLHRNKNSARTAPSKRTPILHPINTNNHVSDTSPSPIEDPLPHSKNEIELFCINTIKN